MQVGASEAETFWTQFLRSPTRRGLRGVNLVISESHEGIQASIPKVLKASWQRCPGPASHTTRRDATILSNDCDKLRHLGQRARIRG